MLFAAPSESDPPAPRKNSAPCSITVSNGDADDDAVSSQPRRKSAESANTSVFGGAAPEVPPVAVVEASPAACAASKLQRLARRRALHAFACTPPPSPATLAALDAAVHWKLVARGADLLPPLFPPQLAVCDVDPAAVAAAAAGVMGAGVAATAVPNPCGCLAVPGGVLAGGTHGAVDPLSPRPSPLARARSLNVLDRL